MCTHMPTPAETLHSLHSLHCPPFTVDWPCESLNVAGEAVGGNPSHPPARLPGQQARSALQSPTYLDTNPSWRESANCDWFGLYSKAKAFQDSLRFILEVYGEI
jgi:hypothetical protein